jgi:hypothetical protein
MWRYFRGAAVKTFNRFGLAIVCAAALSAMGAASAHADTIYTYTGTDFTTVTGTYTTSDSVSGMIDLAAPLGDNAPLGLVTPVSFSFSDGVQTITNTTPLYTSSILLSTNGSGVPTRWVIDLSFTSTFTGIIADSLCCSTYGSPVLSFTDIGYIASDDYGLTQSTAGTWNVTTSGTPLPAALPLFAGGLGAMGLLGWRRKRKNGAPLAA